MNKIRSLLNALEKSKLLWFWLVLYFICYVPYTIQSKSLGKHISALQIFPYTSLGSFFTTIVEFFVLGLIFSKGKDIFAFWKKLQFSVASVGTGIACAMISITTTASYMLQGVAVITMMLLMRGGMLSLAPINDLRQKRKISTKSWSGFVLAFIAICCGILGAGKIPFVGFIILALYIGAYSVSLNFYGKNQGNFLFLCSAQIIACASMLFISCCGIILFKQTFVLISANQIFKGFSIGILAQLIGIFGPLIILTPVEQTYSVPIHRSGSIIAGIVAQKLLGNKIDNSSILGTLFFIAAIIVLATRKSSVQTSKNDSIINLSVQQFIPTGTINKN